VNRSAKYANFNQGPLPQCNLQHPRPKPHQTHQCPPGLELRMGQGHQGMPRWRRGPVNPCSCRRRSIMTINSHDNESVHFYFNTYFAKSLFFPSQAFSVLLLLLHLSGRCLLFYQACAAWHLLSSTFTIGDRVCRASQSDMRSMTVFLFPFSCNCPLRVKGV
jgi:hypothetical protein